MSRKYTTDKMTDLEGVLYKIIDREHRIGIRSTDRDQESQHRHSNRRH
jgi:hypothetical protein